VCSSDLLAQGTSVITAKTADGSFTASATITVADVIISCNNAVAITLPFVINGAGEYCWSTGGTINSINNWSMDLLEINGINYTNKFATAMPARINGLYYIHYKGSFSYAHLEIAGTGGTIIPVTGLTVLPTTATINIAGTQTLTPAVTPTNASDKTVSYTSSNAAVATVSTAGVVTGVAVGSAIITVKTTDGGFTATSTITVQNTTVHVTGVTVLPATATINIAGTQALTPTIAPSNATDKTVSYSSSNTAVATVSTAGVVTGVAVGSAIITVKTTDGGFTATSTITVQNTTVHATGVTVLPATATINVAGTQALTPTVAPSNATDKTVSYTSSNTAIATVSAAGVVTGVAVGSAIITVKTTDGGFTATSTITVNIVTTICASPVAITIPFAQNGVGEFCWVSSQGMSYINSWNMDLVEVNGVAYTNKWASGIPASSDGKWYIHYKASLAWAHFEAAALKSAESLAAEDIRIYPNPFSTEINIDFGSIVNIQKVEIYNSLGQLVQNLEGSQLKSPVMNLNMHNLAGNTFIVKIYLANKIIVKQVVKQ
jgi:uncharacterized protein YjdB